MNTIYYFTGTGNSLKAAIDIAKEIQDCELVSISQSIDTKQNIAPAGVVGFVFPVYYCGFPQIVLYFIQQIDLSAATYIFVAATYGATLGNAGCVSQAKNLFKKKRVTLNAAFYIKSVDNFIIWTWDAPPKEKHKALHDHAALKARMIGKTVSAGATHFDKSVSEYFGPHIFRYKHFVETVQRDDDAFYSTSECTSCGLCAEVCPTGNIRMENGRPVWKSENCQRCLACLHLCPTASVQYGKATAKRQRYRNPYISIAELKG